MVIRQFLIVACLGLLGLVIGTLLDRLVRRLSLYKSPIWPLRDHCEICFQPIPLRDKFPLFGYLLCRGRCRMCQSRLPAKRILLEILAAAVLVGLFEFHVVAQGSHLPISRIDVIGSPQFSWESEHFFVFFVYHSLLFLFLIVATFIDLELMIIPDSVTIPGMIVGLVIGSWYWQLHPVPLWLPPPQTPWNGFLTSLVGLLVGGGVVWIVRAVCSYAFRQEAMGMGDVMLMAMVGSFLGWQTVIIAFFLAPIPAVVVGLLSWIITGRRELPYGPHLSISTVLCVLYWKPLWGWGGTQIFTTGFPFLFTIGIILLVMLYFVSVSVQWCKRLIGR